MTIAALFTCGTTRALHLELVPDLSTQPFLLCFKRFVNRCGIPSLVVTDNAKTFKAASKKLIALFKSFFHFHFIKRFEGIQRMVSQGCKLIEDAKHNYLMKIGQTLFDADNGKKTYWTLIKKVLNKAKVPCNNTPFGK